MDVLLNLNDNLVKIFNVKNNRTGLDIDDAVVTATLKTLADVDVSGQSWPLTFTADGGGVYTGTLESALTMTTGTTYKIIVDVIQGGTLVGHSIKRLKVEDRVE